MTLLCVLSSASFSQESTLSFGVVTDIHYSRVKETNGTRRYQKSQIKTNEAFKIFNERNLDFIVCLGDIIDGESESYLDIKDIFDSSRHPVYKIAGNHDFLGTYGSDIQNHVMETVGFMNTPQAIYIKDFLLLFLDSSAVSTTSSAHHLTESYKRELGDKFRNWNGAFGPEQLCWLEQQLTNADKHGLNVICFAHMPLFPLKSEFSVWDGDQALSILQNHRCVKAYICGHHHKGGDTCSGNLLHLIMQGMIENDDNHFSVITVSKNSLHVEGFGAEESRSYIIGDHSEE